MRTDKERVEFLREVLGLSEDKLEHLMSCDECEGRYDPIGCGCCCNLEPERTCPNIERVKK